MLTITTEQIVITIICKQIVIDLSTLNNAQLVEENLQG